MLKKNKIAFVINHLSFFYSHILPLAEEAKNKGYIIHIFCGRGGSRKMEKEAQTVIKKKGFKYSKFNFYPGMGNIISELIIIFKMFYNINNFSPDIVHGVSIKGILHSCLYSAIFRPRKLICFITGMGYFFTEKLNLYEKIVKYIIIKLIKFSLIKKKSVLVLENNNDINFFTKFQKIDRKKILKLSGVGVNLKKFYYSEKNKKNIILFPSRVLKEKGIFEFYSAAEELSLKYKNWKFLIAGTIDYKKNNQFVNIKMFKKRQKINFLGYVNNIYKLFNKSSIVCLPSYREGFPKSLIEASSSGCAIVTTDVPGCREAVKNNINAFICKPRNVRTLKIMIEKLIVNKKLRQNFSKNSRKIAINNYNEKIFINANINEYQNI